MSHAKTLLAYKDVSDVLQMALDRGGLRYKLPSAARAYAWRHRANRFRALARRLREEQVAFIPGADPSTPYDALVLRIEKESPEIVLVELIKPEGEILDLEGRPVNLTLDDPTLEEEAARVRRDLGLE